MTPEFAAALLMESLVRSAYPEKGSTSVQPLQWSILRSLRISDGEGRDLTSIAKYVGVTPAPASRAVATLEKRGLLTKRAHPENARAVLIELTPKGLEFLEQDPMLRLADRLSGLSSGERAQFLRTLRSLTLNSNSVHVPDEENSSGSG